MKVGYKHHRIKDYYLVVNMIKDEIEGKRIYQQLLYVIERFLPEVKLSYLGGLPFDECVKTAVKSQIPYLKLCPEKNISKKITQIALKLLKFNPQEARGLEQFLEKLTAG
jgi:ATPases involved in chromosome partitioning